jgi:CCR4-NOT transcription complex subunit 1
LHVLLVSLFDFFGPIFQEASDNNQPFSKAMRLLYKGVMRVLLVLLHDFPEFLCFYYFSFCNVIPSCCMQLRNLILSAFPRAMRLPDPFSPNLKIDLLPEINRAPKILGEPVLVLDDGGLRRDLEYYLEFSGTNSTFLASLPSRLHTLNENGTKPELNVALISAIVLHTGLYAISRGTTKTTSDSEGPNNNIALLASNHRTTRDLVQYLTNELNAEDRYLFFNAIANQLRHPNSHTHYFSYVLLGLFKDARDDFVKEQITRVLLERLIVQRPHPWGLLVTFIGLLRNPQYSFWKHPFTRSTPDIEKLFNAVASSCSPTASSRDIVLGTEASLTSTE